ncbi:MAG: FHA domain-containing protein [Proteobacteria bacterium]|nr:FHA domain-containing protein [Pseudomonadota bacterium]
MKLEIRYSPPNQPQQVVPVRDRLMIGSLLSNEIVIRSSAVEPIHAMIEVLENGVHMLTDLGSHSGVLLNGKPIEVESIVKAGDRVMVGEVLIEVLLADAMAAQFNVIEGTKLGGSNIAITRVSEEKQKSVGAVLLGVDHELSSDHGDVDEADDMVDLKATVKAEPRGGDRGSDEDSPMLFSPRHAKPSGNVLEVVSYWDDTILDIELFHPKMKDYEKVKIGVPPHAHFLSGGDSDVKAHRLASLTEEGYTLHLMPDMRVRLRKGGKVLEESGSKSIQLSKHDIAHITQGPIKFFLMFIKPPVLDLPRNSARDPFFMAILTFSLLLYLVAIPAIYLSKNPKDNKTDDDIWQIAAPKKEEELKPIPKPKVEVAEVKVEPPPKPTPPKPPPKPPTPVPPETKPKPVETPKQAVPTPPVEKPTQQLAEPKKPEPQPTPQAEKPKETGMAQAGKKPDFKAPGAVTAAKVGPSGGAQGGDKVRPDAGGQRKGEQKIDLAGAEGGAPNKASGVNLSKLGLGAGKVLSQVGGRHWSGLW